MKGDQYDYCRDVTSAADAFSGLLDAAADRWAQASALAGYSVGALVAHVGAATAFLRPLLDSPPPGDDVPVVPADRYYASLAGGEGPVHDYVRSQSEANAAKGAESNAAYFRRIAAELSARLPAEDSDRLLDARPAFPFAISVADFVATRVVELVVHGDDLATSIGVDFEPPREAADLTVGLLVGTARARHGDLAVLRALARAERAGPGVFPVL